MSTSSIGDKTDRFAIGKGSMIAQLKRLRRKAQVQYDIPPMWGASRLRNETTKTDSSGSVQVTEDTGELKLSTGADGDDRIELRSAQYAQYRSGLHGEASFGIRMSEKPSGNQVARWGYFDDNAGFGWGIDSTGIFTFTREAGSDTIYRRSDDSSSSSNAWSGDPLDGVGGREIELDILDGAVFHVLFQLYGYGPVIWYVQPQDSDAHRAPEIEADSRVYPTQINLVDFNRQLRVELDNDGTAQNLDLYVGGRQYSLWGDVGTFERRDVPTLVRNYNVSSTDTWEAIIAVRKQPNFPTSTSRGNSVSVKVVNVEGLADGDAELKLTFDASITNTGDYATPDEWDNSESAIQTITVDDNTPSVDSSQEGLRVAHSFLAGSNQTQSIITERAQLPLGANMEAVLWARAASTSTSINASLTVEEQW